MDYNRENPRTTLTENHGVPWYSTMVDHGSKMPHFFQDDDYGLTWLTVVLFPNNGLPWSTMVEPFNRRCRTMVEPWCGTGG